jgi:hypothetical protein
MPNNESNILKWLTRPLALRWCLVGWLCVVALMIVIATLWGGPTSADAPAPDNTTWLIAHGDFGCAYPPAASVVYQTTAPLYPLISGALAAVARIGHSLTFPTSTQLGTSCSTATAALYQWSFHSGALTPTLRLGYLGWLALLVGVVSLVRALGRGGTRLEVVTTALVACLPSVYMPLFQYFHPEDLLATGLALVGVALVLRDRWLGAGLVLGLAVLSQQFTLLILIPLLVVAPRPKLLKILGGTACSIALVGVPLLAITSGRALTAILVGTGDVGSSNVAFYGISLHNSFALATLRIIPLALCALVAWWALRRLGARSLEPVALLSMLSLSLALRLAFEVSLFGYYLMSFSVLILLVEIAAGRIKIAYVVWTGVATWATVGGGLIDHATFAGVAVQVWQLLIVGGAVYLATSPLLGVARHDSVEAVCNPRAN